MLRVLAVVVSTVTVITAVVYLRPIELKAWKSSVGSECLIGATTPMTVSVKNKHFFRSISIDTIRASCGCVTPHQQVLRIEPLQTVQLELVASPGAFDHQVRSVVSFFANENWVGSCNVSMEVRAPFDG